MNEQVMIYVISSSANTNSNSLFHKNNKFFYWNQKRFKYCNKQDYVFVINVSSKYVLFTEINAKNIPVSFDKIKNVTSFNDQKQQFNVSGEWDNFVRLKIISKNNIPKNWTWKSLGNSETTYLNGTRINIKSATNRNLNINQLKELSTDTQYQDVLKNCLKNFSLNNSTKTKERATVKSNNMTNYDDILTAIQTKPFILLAGISGTGKSRLVRELAFKTCNNKALRKDNNKPGNYELISVKPNWHDSSELIGYISRISGEKYIATTFIKFIAKAWKYPEIPFFLCLDEMNLAPVEQYFAEYLSIIETRSSKDGIVHSDAILEKKTIGDNNFIKLLEEIGINNNGDAEKLYSQFIKNGIQIPNNLVVMGTVNMDESTYSFSRKVLDRAMTIEMNNIDLYSGLDIENNELSYPTEYISYDSIIGSLTIGAEVFRKFDKSEEVLNYLQSLNKILEGSPFKIAYRVRDEFLIYAFHNNKKNRDFGKALDVLTSMKVLSRLEGDETKVKQILEDLFDFFKKKDFHTSLSKVEEMLNKLDYGYTSFWS